MSEINQISWVIRKILLLRAMFSPLVVTLTFSLSALSSFIVITYYSDHRRVELVWAVVVVQFSAERMDLMRSDGPHDFLFVFQLHLFLCQDGCWGLDIRSLDLRWRVLLLCLCTWFMQEAADPHSEHASTRDEKHVQMNMMGCNNHEVRLMC